MSERRDIGWRLENWARVYRDTHRAGISPTAAFCDELKRQALGDLSAAERRKTDEDDADQIERAMRVIAAKQRRMLWFCYIRQAHPGEICREMGIPHRPASEFVIAFRQAQEAVSAALERDRHFHDAQSKVLDSRKAQQ